MNTPAQHSIPRAAARRMGFSMVELLVAMAILVTVISGVVLLYNGAVKTVRQGYNAIDNFEIGRSTLAAIERDVKRAFTAREYGQFYQFHGGPRAFMYVGILENQRLGRVTYAINELDDNNNFFMTDTIELRTIIERALSAISIMQGAFPGQARGFAEELVLLLARDASITSGTLSQEEILQYLPVAMTAALNEGQRRLGTGEATYWELPPLIASTSDGRVLNFDDATVELEVLVHTGYLLRYEEVGVKDLSAFGLPPDPQSPQPDSPGMDYRALQFPVIDAYDITHPRNNPRFEDYDAVCASLFGGSEITEYGQDLLYCRTYSALVMPANGSLADLDLRNLAQGNSFHTQGFPASYITPQTIDRIFEASKRDLWLQLFTGGIVAERILNRPAARPGDPLYNYNFFDAWRNDDGLNGNPAVLLGNNKNPRDYVVAERIVTRGQIITRQDILDGGYSNFFLQHFAGDPAAGILPFDVLGINAFFTYADVDNHYETHYNSLADIPGYGDFMDPSLPYTAPERFRLFDETLGTEMRGQRTTRSHGSPVAPRIPALVSPRFWIMSEGATTNAPPFKHYFDQVIEVPSSTGRKLPKQLVPDAG
jgi:hypothetical protein